jgi:hypothetical protein
MTFRKSLTTLAAVALIAFAVTMAQAGSCGSPCPSKAQAGGCQQEMKAQGCGHAAMNAPDCGSSYKQQGMAGGCKGHMQKSDCCQGKMPADCCKNNKMMRGNCGGSCEQMDRSKCGSSCGEMNRGGCKWDCTGIWADYDCSNPGGRSLFDCCEKKHHGRHHDRCGDHGDCGDCEGHGNCGGHGDCMMMRDMGCGEGGPRVICIERREGGDGKAECQVRVMKHMCGEDCTKNGCMMMKQMQQGAGAPPCGGAAPAQAPQGGCPHSGK